MRPIDAEQFDVIALDYSEIAKRGYQNAFDDGVQWLAEQIDQAETLDVSPVVHAKWIKICRGRELDSYMCSACRCKMRSFDEHVRNRMLFCNECGASMDGIEEAKQ